MSKRETTKRINTLRKELKALPKPVKAEEKSQKNNLRWRIWELRRSLQQ